LEECPAFAGHFYYFSTNAKKYSLKMLPYAKKSGIIEVLMCNAPSEMDEQSNAMGEETIMDVRPADLLLMRKPHPCGGNTFYVIRSGMDFKLRCTTCGREFMVPRNKIERRIKQVIRETDSSESTNTPPTSK